MQIIGLLLTGLAAGTMAGLLGIGGATVVIPVLIYFYGAKQQLAQGTTLAMMIPPVGLLAAWIYWKNGQMNIGWAIFLCIGFFFGGLIGAYYANLIPEVLLRKIFGGFLLLVAMKMIFWG